MLPATFLISAEIAGQDLVQVADHRVVGAREDRGLRVGVDREDPLRAPAAGHVLRRAADPARDVEVGRDLRPRLPDLVGVRPPAGARHGARAADGAAEQAGELLDDGEALRRARRRARRETTTFASASETPPAGAATCSDTRTARSASESAGVNGSTAGSRAGAGSAATACGCTVRSAGAP